MQLAHSVPLDAVVHPAEHAQLVEPVQTPFKQLHPVNKVCNVID
jgi:hypothetical protein